MDRIESLLAYRKVYQSTWTDYLYIGMIIFMWHFSIWYWWEVLLVIYVVGHLYAAHKLNMIDDVIEKELNLKI